MKIDLRSLQPNPTRDFAVDPLDQEAIGRLQTSIEEDGFWGGIVCRKAEDGKFQIGAGHHRVAAAIAAGITHADVFVSTDMDDDAMCRVYARENATQRGNSGAARAGSVASALRIVAKHILGCESDTYPEFRRRSQDTANGQAATAKGIGEPLITEYLKSVPGICKASVSADLASLKASGHYARIMAEVEAEIAEEAEEARLEAERAEQEQREAEERGRKEEAEQKAKKAAEAKERADSKEKAKAKAAKAKEAAAEHNPRVFDFEGVAKHLKNSHQIDAFRQSVTGQGVASLLPVEKQAELAAYIVEEVAEKNKEERGKKTEVTGEYVRNAVTRLVIDAKRFKANADKATREAAIRYDLEKKAKSLQHDFAGYFRSMARVGTQITELMASWPKEIPFPITGEFRDVLGTAKKVVDSLNERI